jgi:alkyl hydroperoxide reductase subunit AhpC
MLRAMTKHIGFIAVLLSLVVATAACEGRGTDPNPAQPVPPAPTLAQETKVAEAPSPSPAAPAPAALTAKAELGKPAPDFTLTEVGGKSFTLSAFKGKTVVLEWFNPDCPFVKYARGEGELKTMAAKLMGEDLIWLSINSSAPGKQGHGTERNQAALAEYKIQNPLLLDETGTVGKSYGAEKTPHLFIVGKDGNLIYRGAVDNAPIGKVDPERPVLPGKEGQLVNYVGAALEDAAAIRALRLPETAAYGCSVKYES